MRQSRKRRVRYPDNTSSPATARDHPRGLAAIVLGVAGAIVRGGADRWPDRHAARYDRHAVYRAAARQEQPEPRVAALVVGGALAIDRVEQDVVRGPERDLLHGLGEVPTWSSLWPLRAARRAASKSRVAEEAEFAYKDLAAVVDMLTASTSPVESARSRRSGTSRVGGMAKGKGLIRSLNRRGTRSAKVRPVEARAGRPREGAICERCGAMFSRRTWRRDHAVSDSLLARAAWVVCPACEQTGREEYFGRVLIRGGAAADEDAIRRRIQNVAARAGFTQPERRVVSVERRGKVLEVLTTSQKLAHRIAHELKKAFGGRTSYVWSDDRTLLASWQPREVPATKARRRP
jgi:hypothetical protein